MKFNPYEKTSIDQFVDAYESEQVTEGTISFKEKINDSIIIKFHNVISKHIDLMKPYIVDVVLTDDEYARYKCLPNLFCYDIYGTPELAYSLLYINNMVSITEFTRKSIKAFTTDINDVIKELMILNQTDLEHNQVEVYG